VTLQEILELGCGWGSFSLYAAAAYPKSKVRAEGTTEPFHTHFTCRVVSAHFPIMYIFRYILFG
jgi:cyclopropane fatty-acyl-phospholipid synthase-like methyltransferase